MKKEENRHDARELLHVIYDIHQNILADRRFDLLPKIHQAFGIIEQLVEKSCIGVQDVKQCNKLVEVLAKLTSEICIELGIDMMPCWGPSFEDKNSVKH